MNIDKLTDKVHFAAVGGYQKFIVKDEEHALETLKKVVDAECYDRKHTNESVIHFFKDGGAHVGDYYPEIKTLIVRESVALKQGSFNAHLVSSEVERAVHMAKSAVAAVLELTKDDAKKIMTKVKAPFVNVKMAPLGGMDLMIAVSLDDKKDWRGGYLENSNYFRMILEGEGVLEQFMKSSGVSKKFRKSRVKSVDDAIAKINKYISQVS